MAKKDNTLLYLGAAAALLLLSKKSVNGINGEYDYYEKQLQQIDPSDPYGVKIKITQGNNKTNFINLNRFSVASIRAWLKANDKYWK